MDELYHPASDFLLAIIDENVTLSGSAFAEMNLRRLIALTRDDDLSNRDWATMLLAMEEVDTPEVRAALLAAVEDTEEVVRAEALVGLAERDRVLALPYAIRALAGDWVSTPVLEAAALIADAALVEHLEPWSRGADDPYFDQLVRDALEACRTGVPR